MQYPTDVTDATWNVLRPLFDIKRRGPKRGESKLRRTLDAIFYVLRSGCPPVRRSLGEGWMASAT